MQRAGRYAVLNVTLQYFDSCPNWRKTDQRLRHVADAYGLDIDLRHQLIESFEAAEEHGFHGSPTILIDGVDPFATGDTKTAFACRIYHTTDGHPTDAPSVDQIAQALGVE